MKPDDVVLITGATSGLGRAIARQLASRRCRLALTGRRLERLTNATEECRALGAPDVLSLHGSVADLETARDHYQTIRERWGRIDAAILNAGVADSAAARHFNVEDYRWTFETNLFGVCNWIEVMLPDMLDRSNGVIAGISSPGGWRGFPGMGSYASSKAALSTMLESLRVELRGSGIDIVTVCPGWVKSEITSRNEPGSMWMLLETDDGARRIIRGIERRKRVVHFPFPLTHVLRYMIRPLPGWIFDPLITRIVKRDKKPYVDESAGP